MAIWATFRVLGKKTLFKSYNRWSASLLRISTAHTQAEGHISSLVVGGISCKDWIWPWTNVECYSMFQNALRKTPLFVLTSSFYAYLLAEVLQNTWHSWGDFLQGHFKLPGMKVAQSLLLLLPFRKNICENSDCVHLKACCYIYKEKCWWFGFLRSQFCCLSVGKQKTI